MASAGKERPMASVAVLGSFNMDLVVQADHLPRPGRTVLGRSFHRGPGGKGSNQAIAARRLGADVSFIGAVGDDDFGRAARRLLEAEGVDTAGLATVGSPTGVALIVVDTDGENQIAVAPGANSRITPGMVVGYKSAIANANVLLAQLETPLDAFLAAARIARAHGTVVILNPAPAMRLPERVWALTDVLTPNQHEIVEMFGSRKVEPATFEHRRSSLELIVTRGREGAAWIGATGTRTYLAFPAQAIDTTGAGDAFNAGLAVGIAEEGIEAGIVLGLRAGAFAVTRIGVLDGLATRAELDSVFPTPHPLSGSPERSTS